MVSLLIGKCIQHRKNLLFYRTPHCGNLPRPGDTPTIMELALHALRGHGSVKGVIACICHDLHERVADWRMQQLFVAFGFVALDVELHEDGDSKRGTGFNIGPG